MGLLDDLKKQTAEQQAKEQSARQLKEQQFAFFKQQLQPKLESLYSYLHEFSEHLNYIKPDIRVNYTLKGDITLSNLSQQDYVLKANSRENMSDVALRFHCRGEDTLYIEADNKAHFEQLKDFFYQHRLEYRARATKDERQIILGGDITLTRNVPVLFQFTADIDNGYVVLRIRNFEQLGVRQILILPHQIDAAFMDNLGHYLLREIDTFMKLEIEDEQRSRLQAVLARDKLRKLQETERAEQWQHEEEHRESAQKFGFRFKQQLKNVYTRVRKP